MFIVTVGNKRKEANILLSLLGVFTVNRAQGHLKSKSYFYLKAVIARRHIEKSKKKSLCFLLHIFMLLKYQFLTKYHI